MARSDVFVWSTLLLCLLILCQFVNVQSQNTFALIHTWIGSASTCSTTASSNLCDARASECTAFGFMMRRDGQGAPNICTSCDGGFLQAGDAKSTGWCTRCPEDTYRPLGSFNQCIKCPTQTYTTHDTSESPEQCLSASDLVVNTPVSNSIQSMQCINDGWRQQINATDGSTYCARCMYGHHDTALDAMVTCSPCPLNTFREDGTENTCVPCSAQHLSPTGSKTCTLSGVIRRDYGNKTSCDRWIETPSCVWSRSVCNASFGAVDRRVLAQTYSCLSCIGGMKITDATVSTMDPVCEDCPVNTYRVEGTPNTCLPCPASSPKSLVRSTSLGACQAPCARGTTISSSGFCVKCGKGTYKDTVADSACKVCPAGKFSGSLGAGSLADCTTCPSNSVSLAGSDEKGDCNCQPGFTRNVDLSCTPCAKGTYKDANAPPNTACMNCGAGKFSDVTQSQSEQNCNTCPSNSDSLAGSDEAVDCMCKPGFTKGAAPICRTCEPGSWKSDTGNGACTPCGLLRTSLQSGNTLQSSCVCIDKHADNGASDGQCVLCGDGTYRNTLNNGVGSQCVACPQQYSASALTQAQLLHTTHQCIQFV